jgi:MAP/microtubule affinity-regulating kinase
MQAEVINDIFFSMGHLFRKQLCLGEVFDYLVAHGRMKEKEARSKFRQVSSK